MRKYWKASIFLLMVVGTVIYTYYLRPIVDDELFNYGFSVNLLNGMVPYRDFNMIIPPLFSYLVAVILKIFGMKLLVYHFVIAGIIVGITYFCYRKFKWNALIIYLLLLLYPYTGYNMWVLFLLFLLLNVVESKKAPLYEAILIGMMILTKQTLALMIIPSILYSKDRKRLICVYGIFGLGFLLYLIINQNLGEFINYCFLGMFDFTTKNHTGINLCLLLEVIILIGLVWLVIRTKRKDLFYVLMFQIIVFPIVNYIHFLIGFVPVVYLLLLRFKDNRLILLECFVATVFFFFGFHASFYLKNQTYLYYTYYEVNNFMKGRLVSCATDSYLEQIYTYLDKYQDHSQYILGNFSYLVKLNGNIPITKFDIINNGNMGYHGSYTYIQEIDKDCQKNSCVFIINDEEMARDKYVQTNREILEYVSNHYVKEYASNIFSVYVNELKVDDKK